MEIETKLGHLVMGAHKFKVRLPELGVKSPEYIINPCDLKERTIIGHVVMLPSGPTLVISRITKVHHESDEFSVIDWPSHVTSEPILHHWDTRTVDMLAVNNFFIDLNTIQCIFH